MSDIDRSLLRRLADMHAVYRMFDQDGRLLYVGSTKNPGGRFGGHLEKRWFLQVVSISLEWFPTKAAAVLAENRAIQSEHPRLNVAGTTRSGCRPVPVGPLSAPLPPARLLAALETLDPPRKAAGSSGKVAQLVAPPDGQVTLTQAIALRILPGNIAAVRKQAQRSNFPSPAGKSGAAHLYDIRELEAYADAKARKKAS